MDPSAERTPADPTSSPMHLEGSDEDVVAVSDEPLPPLTDEDVRAAIERSRR